MKKLMIAAAVVCAAAFAQASSWNWTAASGMLFVGDGSASPATGTKITSGATGYLFALEKTEKGGSYVDGAFTQQMLLTALSDGTYDTVADAWAAKGVTTAPQTPVNASAQFAKSADFTFGTTGKYYDFYVVVDAQTAMPGDVFIFSSVADKQASDLATPTPLTMGTFAMESLAKPITTGEFAGTGWYQTASVPEPTSAMLLLLGVAGLALKRKRA